MNKIDVKQKIDEFISKLKKEWNDLEIHFAYDDIDEIWDIWHHDSWLPYNNTRFQETVGSLIGEIFFDHGIYNVSFGYLLEPRVETYTSSGYTNTITFVKVNKNSEIMKCDWSHFNNNESSIVAEMANITFKKDNINRLEPLGNYNHQKQDACKKWMIGLSNGDEVLVA